MKEAKKLKSKAEAMVSLGFYVLGYSGVSSAMSHSAMSHHGVCMGGGPCDSGLWGGGSRRGMAAVSHSVM